jgi:hypothetical protein
LVRWGILTRNVAPDQLQSYRDSMRASEADELVDRMVGDWRPMPPPPENGFALQAE